MSFLDEYKRLAETETDNEFPEHMEHDGLSESDRQIYEEVLSKMRADMDKANEDMRKNANCWGDVCEEINGSIQNKTYKMNAEMLMNKMNEGNLKGVISKSEGKMYAVSEPFGLFVEGFRCPKCGKLMYSEENRFVCPCGYNEEGNEKRMQFYFVDNTYTRTPLAKEDNYRMCEMFRKANKK